MLLCHRLWLSNHRCLPPCADISLELMLISSKFGLDALRDLCLEHIRKQLTPENAIEMLRRAVTLKAEAVRFPTVPRSISLCVFIVSVDLLDFFSF